MSLFPPLLSHYSTLLNYKIIPRAHGIIPKSLVPQLWMYRLRSTASSQKICTSFSKTPNRQDVWKTHIMTEVCLTDTYTGTGFKINVFSSCASPSSLPPKTIPSVKKHRNVGCIAHISFHMPTLLSCVHRHSTHTQSQAKRAQRAKAVILGGRFSWSSEAWLVPIPVPWPESQETHTGNSFTQQDRNASSQKN